MTETTTIMALDVSTSADSGEPTGVMAPADALGVDPSMSNLEGESQESTECPTCGRDDFSTEQGMKVHHKRIHGESLAGVDRVCEYCGGEFTAKQARVDRGDAKYCSMECRHAARQKPTVKRTCRECGDEFTVPKQQLKHRPAHHCSFECAAKKLSRERVGEDHPNWKGGQQPYGRGWTDAKKEAVRDRDGHECQRCGMDQAEHMDEYGQKLDVHHIVPARQFDDPEQRNAMDNLATLCIPCHRKWEGIPLRPGVAANE